METIGTTVPVVGWHTNQVTNRVDKQRHSFSCSNCTELWSKLSQLRKHSKLCDVQIFLSDGAVFNAHSVLLACRSEVFNSYFLRNDNEPGLKRISLVMARQKMDLVLDYIYGRYPQNIEQWNILKG